MPTPAPATGRPVAAVLFGQAHQLYCQLTGQSLGLGFHRERMWFELLRAGHSLQDLRAVIAYLQREIRAGRRNVGALKLSNLLQPDRFEEDLQISRVRLRAPPTAWSGPRKAPTRSKPRPSPPTRPGRSWPSPIPPPSKANVIAPSSANRALKLRAGTIG